MDSWLENEIWNLSQSFPENEKVLSLPRVATQACSCFLHELFTIGMTYNGQNL
jgi:hypothetical protein